MISVLIPVYNTDPIWLSECMDSVYTQTHDPSMSNSEVIVVDNGSTRKGTIAELQRQESIRKNFKLLHVPRQENKRNLSIALNHGLRECKYELVARMDSDDIMYPDRLITQCRYLMKNKHVDICGALVDSDPPPTYESPNIPTLEDIIKLTSILHHPTVIFKKSKILALGGYQEDDPNMAEDLELWIRCLQNNLVIHNLNDVLVYYRLHTGNSAKSDSEPYLIKRKIELINGTI